MKCRNCTKDSTSSETYFCYWCGHSVCAQCVRYVLLPLDTEAAVCPDCQHKPAWNDMVADSMMALMVEAALVGHDLTEWVLVEDGSGWQTQCRLCQETAWVGISGGQYSLLSDHCLGLAA